MLLGDAVGAGAVVYAVTIGPGLALAYRRLGAHHLIRPARRLTANDGEAMPT